MGARQRDHWLAGSAADSHHVAAQPLAVVINLTGNLLGGRAHAFGPLGLAAHSDDDETARIGPAIALHHTGDDLALMGGELAECALVFGVAEPLQHDLPRGGSRDSPETLRGVFPLAEHNAVIVEFAGEHLDRTGFPVDFDVRVRLMTFGVPVRAEHRGLDIFEQVVERDSSFHHDRVQSGHVDVHVLPSISALGSTAASSNSRLEAGENSTWTTALTISPIGTGHTVQSRARSSRTTSISVLSAISPTRPVTCVPSANATSTLRPRARRKCFSLVSGRSTPGELTSST